MIAAVKLSHLCYFSQRVSKSLRLFNNQITKHKLRHIFLRVPKGLNFEKVKRIPIFYWGLQKSSV